MFKRIAFVSLLAINTCYADQLTNYKDAIDALNNGKRLTFVVDWDTCKITNPNGTDTKANFSSSYTSDAYLISKLGFVYVRGVTVGHPIAAMPQLGIVTQSFAYTLKGDGSLHAINRFLDPVTYAEKIKPIEADCQLGDGFKLFAA